ncbi:MAG: hypothetical protein HRU70_02285 [Phycisphaeraceae bacterium]|nr:MAG: hypothetical protein HRU70_02285 [Phycisphaeraceae bacterium]
MNDPVWRSGFLLMLAAACLVALIWQMDTPGLTPGKAAAGAAAGLFLAAAVWSRRAARAPSNDPTDQPGQEV